MGRKRVYAVGALGGAAWSVGFIAFAHDSTSLIIGVVGGLAFHSVMYGPQAAFIAEQFPARLRYTGASLGYTLAGLIGGAVAPLVFTTLVRDVNAVWLIGLYITVACAITLVGLTLGR
jgi:MFS family permease